MLSAIFKIPVLVNELLKTSVDNGADSDVLIMLLEVITNVLESETSFRKKLQAFIWLEHILDNSKDNIQDEIGIVFKNTKTVC